jgi:predicted small secreted protein
MSTFRFLLMFVSLAIVATTLSACIAMRQVDGRT